MDAPDATPEPSPKDSLAQYALQFEQEMSTKARE
jgi:hypothetical protein